MADSFEEIYQDLNTTVTELYETLSRMTDVLEVRTNLSFLKQKYIRNSNNPNFLNRLLACAIPHEKSITKRDRVYFEKFILSQITVSAEDMVKIREFINSLTPDYMDILWTYADNFNVLTKRFRKLRNSAWLNEQCIDHIIRITENFDGVTIKKEDKKYILGKGVLTRKNGTYWLNEHDLGLSVKDLEKFENEVKDFLF